MIAALLLSLGLVLAPPRLTTRDRLHWLAAHRWRAPETPAVRASRPLSGRLADALLVLGGAIISAGFGPVVGALTLASGLVLRRCWRQLRREKAVALDAARLAAAVAAVAAEHRAGATLSSALENAGSAAGRFREAFRRAAHLAAMGGEPAEALPDPALAPLAVALSLLGRSGASVADVLTRVRDDLLDTQRTRSAVTEAVAGPRSSAMLLAGLPVVGLVMGVALGAHPVHVLTRTPIGLFLLVGGVSLNLLGVAWSLSLTRPRSAPEVGRPPGRRK